MNLFSISRVPLLLALLACPVVKATVESDLAKTILSALGGGAAGYATGAASKYAGVEKLSRGYVSPAHVENVTAHTTYSVLQDETNGGPTNPKLVIRHLVPAVVAEASLSTKIGQAILKNTPWLNGLHERLSSLLVYLAFNYAAGQALNTKLGIH